MVLRAVDDTVHTIKRWRAKRSGEGLRIEALDDNGGIRMYLTGITSVETDDYGNVIAKSEGKMRAYLGLVTP